MDERPTKATNCLVARVGGSGCRHSPWRSEPLRRRSLAAMPYCQKGAAGVVRGFDETLRDDLRLCPLDPSNGSGFSRSAVEP